MRIRKSVPEGYKTTPAKPKRYAFSPPVDPAGNTSPEYTCSSKGWDNDNTYAELAPYCGGLKIGNLAVQTFPEPAPVPAIEPLVDDQWDMDPFGSQDSTGSGSVIVTVPNLRKRMFDSDLDSCQHPDPVPEDIAPQKTLIPLNTLTDQNFNSYWSQNLVSSTCSPLQPPTPCAEFPKLRQGRRPPRSTSAKSYRPCRKNWGQGQENQAPATVIGLVDTPIGDFEEAVFLRRREEVDDECGPGGGEVNMGGI
jgi:hypothetical protein